MKHFSLSSFRKLSLLRLIIPIFLAMIIAQQVRAASFYVRDEFAAASYSNNNGSANWTSNWTEANDDNAAASGNIRITSGALLISSRTVTSDADLEEIQRSVSLANLVSNSAILSFDFTLANLEAADTMVVEFYNGAAWNQLEVLSGSSTGSSRQYNVTTYASASSALRFRLSGGFDATNETITVDNVQITYDPASTHTDTSLLEEMEVFYISIPEDQGLTVLKAINPNAVDPMQLYLSISIISKNTVIYLDQQEDGYETSLNQLQQNSTEVWGDNNAANGMPPGYTTDRLNPGEILILNNWVPTTHMDWMDLDGGDKILSTQAIAVTRTGWASGSGTLHGGSVEMFPTSLWGTEYDVPVDSTVQNNGVITTSRDFAYTGITVMAAKDNTIVYRNGVQAAILNEGKSYLFNNTLALGDEITASNPIQVNLLVGDIGTGNTYESDWMTLFPSQLWSSKYYAPVNSEGGVTTAVFLNNPGTSQITIQWETTAGAQTAVTVPADSTRAVKMPTTASGAYFYTTGSPAPNFQAISLIDSGSPKYDWGYTLIPDTQLGQQAVIGWGVGRDPTSTVNPTENGSPVWVIAVGTGSIKICADFNDDGLGALMDTNGHRYDQLYTLTNLGRAKIYDTDGDQTGMRIYLCNGSEDGNTNKIAAAWGQDPATATVTAPGLDVGTTVPSLGNFDAVKSARLVNDVNGDNRYDLGDTFEYKINIQSTGALPVPAGLLTVADIIPANTTYVPNSTRIDGVSIPDDTTGTAFPLDIVGGYHINKTLFSNRSFLVTFEVMINPDLSGPVTIQNSATVSGLNITYSPTVVISVDDPTKIGDFIWLDLNGDGLQAVGEPGLPGVMVELFNGNCTIGSTCPTEVTDLQGKYTFGSLSGSNYTVIVRSATLPAGVTQTGDPDGACPGPSCDNQLTVVLTAANKPYWSADFGYQGTGSIGDTVWHDEDRTGDQDPGEAGLEGITVNLEWAGMDGSLAVTADNLWFTTQTDANGSYLFSGLPAGPYKANLDVNSLPVNYSPTTAAELNVTLTGGQNYATADFGAATPEATIGDIVWNDLDNDGTKDSNEGGLSGIRVYIDSNNNSAYDSGEAYATTDANGEYLIHHLAPGTFTVRVDSSSVPVSYSLTTSSSFTANLGTGGSYLTADFGYRGQFIDIAKVSGANGKVAPGEQITYTLTIRNNTAQTENDIAITDNLPDGVTYVANSTTVSGYTLASNGYYLDTFPTAGSYTGSGTGSLAWGSNWTETDAGGTGAASGNIRVVADATNCNSGNCLRFALSANGDLIYRQANLTAAACTAPAVITLSYDYNNLINLTGSTLLVQLYTGTTLQRTLATYNGGNSGVGSASFVLNSAEIANNTRIQLSRSAGTAGMYFFMDNVRFDCQKTGSSNKNNVAGGGDDLANGVPAGLVSPLDGFALDPGQSMQVTYKVTVNDPASVQTVENIAEVSSLHQLTPRQSSTTDAVTASIGNRVWADTDGDGIQDAGEAGIQGVQVGLYQVGNATPLSTTTTDASGLYQFNGLTTGNYYIQFNLPAGYAFSPQNQGSELAIDSDANSASGKTAVFALINGQEEYNFDAGLNDGTSTIGDRIWLDENGDGLQDAGETGIANAEITLTGSDNSGSPVSLTTITDSNGRYIFHAAPGTYTVAVNTGSLPTGLANQTGDPDQPGVTCTTCNNQTHLTVGAGVEISTADFGYNWASASATNENTGAGAIGSRIWRDANGNGKQETNEPGIEGVTVNLYTDPDGDGIYSNLAGTTTTGETGNYILASLPAGVYEIRVDISTLPVDTTYTLTGDPDQAGQPCALCDNKTTAAVILAPGDVYLNVDFGYQPAAASIIGDLIYFDAAGDGSFNQDDYGIAGLDVSLLIDLNNNQTNDPGEPIIATVTTGSLGEYSFAGVPAGSYLILVSDPANLLSGLKNSGDPDGGLNGLGAMMADGSSSYLAEDFGYTPQTQAPATNLIGDTIYIDQNNNHLADESEGQEGVRANLYNAGGVLIASATTDENGHYAFAGLADGTYTVRVDSSTLPTGLTNTSDPDGGAAGQATVSIAGGSADLDQDFGYNDSTAPNTVSGTIWADDNANGSLDGEEAGRFEGVSVALLNQNRNVVASSRTDASGNFSFTNLPDGTFTIAVTDTAQILAGTWHSRGADNTNNNSQADPFTVSISNGQTVDWADFGYYQAASSLGNWVWTDLDKDGVQDAGELGYSGAQVTLTITYPNETLLTLVAITNGSGYYSFANILLDEDYDGAGLSEPVFSIALTLPQNYLTSPQNTTSESLDSDNPAGENAVAAKGAANLTYDFGIFEQPTAVSIVDLSATNQLNTVVITWSSEQEIDLLGFNLFRSTTINGQPEQINSEMISSQTLNNMIGADYSWLDNDVSMGVTYYYWVEAVYLTGSEVFGPIVVTPWRRMYLTTILK